MAEFAVNGVLTNDADADLMVDAWEMQYFGGFERPGTGDYDSDELTDAMEQGIAGANPTKKDTDDDGQSDWAEWIAGTGLTNKSHRFEINDMCRTNTEELVIYWDTVFGRQYSVLSRTNLLDPYWTTNIAGIIGDGTRKGFTNSDDGEQKYFRIDVHN
jgi:hypothetical protein